MPDETTQDPMTLPAGRELDALVAERVMGAPPECRLVGAGTLDDPMCLDHPTAVWRVRTAQDTHWERWSPDGAERVVNEFLPRYSTDLAAAWTVVERAPLVFRAKDIRLVGDTYKSTEAWHTFVRELPNYPFHLAAADLALAICRAALAALTRAGA
jgi:hypothetical protein